MEDEAREVGAKAERLGEKVRDVAAKTTGKSGRGKVVFGVHKPLANLNRRNLLTRYSPPPVVVAA